MVTLAQRQYFDVRPRSEAQNIEALILAASVILLLGVGALPILRENDALGAVASGDVLSRHAGLDVAGHAEEGLLNVGGVLGGGLNEGDIVGVSEALGHLSVDNLLGHEIALVSDEELVDVVRGVLLNLREPLLHVVEALHIGDIIDDSNAVGAAVVGGGDGAEALLASGIPDLHLNGLALDVEGANFEVDANGGDVRLSVRVINEAKQKAGLTDAGIANQKDLEEVIVFGGHLYLAKKSVWSKSGRVNVWLGVCVRAYVRS